MGNNHPILCRNGLKETSLSDLEIVYYPSLNNSRLQKIEHNTLSAVVHGQTLEGQTLERTNPRGTNPREDKP